MIQENVSLKPYNTFGIEVQTRYFAEASSEADLETILDWYRAQKNGPLLVLGGGSNVLFTKNWPGLVLKISLQGRSVHEQCAIGAAGESWHEFVLWTLDQGLYGLENLSLIAGQVGTAPMQNIGAYGVEIKDVFDSLKAININTGKVKTFTHQDCGFGYRDSVFKQAEKGQWIITEVKFKLSSTPQLKTDYGTIQTTLQAHGITKPTPQQLSQAVIAIRQSKLPDPSQIGNAGSFFKNPVIKGSVLEKIQAHYPDIPYYEVATPTGEDQNYKVPAGWLIEKTGWKGHNRQTHGVHDKQALVLVNYGGASGHEIWQLAQEIQQSVKKHFGITLTPEVNVI